MSCEFKIILPIMPARVHRTDISSSAKFCFAYRAMATAHDGESLRARLEAYAQNCSQHALCPCRYLGAWIGGQHLPNSSLRCCAAAESKDQISVRFSWDHTIVGSQKKAHVVGIRVDSAVHHQSCLLGNPLRSRNQGLNFSIEWLNAFADLKKHGVSYRGVLNENVEHPDIVRDLPLGGIDIQDVPLLWDFPCGQCRCFSIMELYNLPEDEFLLCDCDSSRQPLLGCGSAVGQCNNI